MTIRCPPGFVILVRRQVGSLILALFALHAFPIETAADAPASVAPVPASDDLIGATAADQRAGRLARSPDDKRPQDQFTTNLFGRPLTIGGEVGSKLRSREDFRLDPDARDDLTRFDLDTQIEFFYSINPNLFAFAELRAGYEQDIDRENNREDSGTEIRRGEMWLYWANLADTSFSLQAGRQEFRDKREWWWNRPLDAVRLHYDAPALHLEFAVAKELFGNIAGDGIEPPEEDVTRLLGHLSWAWAHKQRVELFVIHQRDGSHRDRLFDLVADDDADAEDADLTWAGVHARGRWKARRLYAPLNRIHYWLNVAQVRGSETRVVFADIGDDQLEVNRIEDHDIAGWGADVGLTWESKLPGRPRFTLSYAYGSGKEADTDDDGTGFRQTGLQNNNGKYRGVDRFRYYGELLRPELANLRIATVAIGVPMLRNSSVEIVAHDYRQVDASSRLRAARIGAGLNGIDRDVGREYDLVIGLEEWSHVEIEIIASLFTAGRAYGAFSDQTATNIALKIDYNF